MYIIFGWSATLDSDAEQPSLRKSTLYTLTRVSKSFSRLALPEYLKFQPNLLPKSTYDLYTIRGETFNLLPAWIRSDQFKSKQTMVFYFSPPKKATISNDVEEKIGAIKIMMSSLPQEDRPRSISFEGDLTISQVCSLLDIAGRAGTTSIEVDVWDMEYRRTRGHTTIHPLVQTDELTLNCHALSAKHWPSLLSAITAPNLKILKLSGDVPWTALAKFLARHPTITDIQLPARNLDTRQQKKISTLRMPRLENVRGKLLRMMQVLRVLSPKKISTIKADAVRDDPLIKTVREMTACVASCHSDISLDINIISTQQDGPLATSHPFPPKTLACLRQSPRQLLHLSHLRIRAEGIGRSVLLVSSNFLQNPLIDFNNECAAQGHCENIMAVFPRLSFVIARRDRGSSHPFGWEWAKVERDSSTDVAWVESEPFY